MRATVATLILLLIGAAVPPAGGAGPGWRTLQTTHFRIHAYDQEIALALRLAPLAEAAFERLTGALKWMPSGRIDITLSDNTDRANGFAGARPRNFIFAFAAPPESLSTLNDFDDWLTLVITHELTHVVHLDVTLGLPRLLNFLSGKIYAPNHVQPTWFVEGLAMLEESAQTTGGRTRNSLGDMFLRMATLHGGLLALDEASNDPLVYPFGAIPYLYGASFLQYLSDRFGPDKLAEISQRYGSRLIPFSLGRTARESLGQGYDELWDDWRAALRRRYEIQADELRRTGVTATRQLTFDGEGSAGGLAPRFLPDGHTILYQRTASDRRPAYVALDATTGRRQVVTEINGAGPASPAPDGRSLVFQRVNFVRLSRRIAGAAYADWDDLFRLDLDSGNIRALTNGLRLHEPAVSPDGSRIACTRSRPGAVDLVILPVAGGTPTVLGPTEGADISYTPSWSPNGRHIVYSRWKPGGYRDIHLYDLRDGSDHALWIDRAIDTDPQFSPDGRFIVLSSDRSGIYNIYAYELATANLFEVTNVLGGAFQPIVSPDGKTLVFVDFSMRGFDLHAMDFKPESWRLAPPVLSARADAAPPATLPNFIESTTNYQPWKYLYPRAWDISAASNPLGLGPGLGLTTTVDDPVGNHQMALGVDVPARSGDASVRLDYTYLGFFPALGLTAARGASLASGLVIDGQDHTFRQHTFSLGSNVSLPVWRTADARSSLSLGGNWHHFGPADAPPVANPALGITRPPEAGSMSSLYLSWTFSNVRTWTTSISGQQGRSLDLTIEHAAPRLAGPLRSTSVTWGWTEYLTPPWARRAALAVRYTGGISIGNDPQSYWLGGFAEQDVVQAFFLNRPQCCQYLRGYAADSIVGTQFHLASMEYRTPLLQFERGFQTVPLYARRLHGAVFTDAGHASVGAPRPRDILYGVGAELRLDFKIAYRIDSTLFLGLARGLSKGGVTDYYMVSSFPF